jgi:hypothetical protein
MLRYNITLHMKQFPPKSPSEKETSKTQAERAEDVAYTLNHAISCSITDVMIQPPIGAWVQEVAEHGKLPEGLRWIPHIFESHDHPEGVEKHAEEHHHHDEHCHEEHHHESQDAHAHGTGFLKNAGHWFLGEAVGDVGAVPLTIMVQRHAPGVMHGLRKMLEPIAGPFFRKGARRDAGKWAIQQGVAVNGPEAKERENLIYEHEVSHLPQAVVWNIFSVPINLATQRLSGSRASWGVLATGKVFGSVVSNGLLLGGRAVAPESFEKWDRFSSRHAVVPVAKAVSGVFGVDKRSIEREAAQEEDDKWSGRVNSGSGSTERSR